jgi:isoleucyl-tRNA synthetase
MGDWLRGNVDWALSRERYWGTPLPIWVCEGDSHHLTAIGSVEDIRAHGGEPPEDLHKPYIDDVVIECPHCDSPARRVPEVIDVWWDSGCMPFAQWHAPHENEKQFEQHFPAQYICEALDQTRGWFYSLLAISTILFGRSSYETCLCLGLMVDGEGQKMSKSRGNIVPPWEVLNHHGADAFRWYFFTSKQPWDGYRFSMETVGESVRQFMLTLWNTYAFYVLYANLTEPEERELTDIDRWIRSRLAATVETATERMEAYDTTTAGRAIGEFVDDLSNWYVRASRKRFYGPDGAAFSTLHECLVTVSKLLAPLTPFIADEIYDNLDGSEPSVHLCDWPVSAGRDERLEWQFEVAREAVELGRKARAEGKLGLRQPLREAVIVAGERERDAIERFSGLVRDELNVKELRFVGGADELGRWELKPNYRTLGPRLGKRMPKMAEAVGALDPQAAVMALRDGGSVGVVVDGEEYPLTAEDVQMVLQPLEGYQVERAGTHAVALNLELDAELIREGLAREVVRAIQNARKSAGLNVEDRIALTLGGDEELVGAARAHEEYIAGEVLATQVSYDGAAAGEVAEIKGRELRIAVQRA